MYADYNIKKIFSDPIALINSKYQLLLFDITLKISDEISIFNSKKNA